jgi:hypothetical protein
VLGHCRTPLRTHQREELVSDAAVDLCPMLVAVLYPKIFGEGRARKIVERLEEARELCRQREARVVVQGEQCVAPQWLTRQPRIAEKCRPPVRVSRLS